MKKRFWISAVLAAILAIFLVACGQQGGGNEPAPEGNMTMGEVFAAERSNTLWMFDQERFEIAYEDADGRWMHYSANLPEGMYDELNACDFDEEKIVGVLGDVEVANEEVVAESSPSEEELAAYVGKTGAELAAEGFEFRVNGLVVNGDETWASTVNGPFNYLITFDGVVPDEATEDPAAAVADMNVLEVGFQGIDSSVLGFQF